MPTELMTITAEHTDACDCSECERVGPLSELAIPEYHAAYVRPLWDCWSDTRDEEIA